MITHVIALYGGPGCGKSTLAAELYYRMKTLRLNCELVREYVKDWAYTNRKIQPYDQLYICAKQLSKEYTLYGKVDWIVTDSPTWTSAFYSSHYFGHPFVTEVTQSFVNFTKEKGDVIQHNFLLSREKEYNPVGRYETEEQAKNLDRLIRDFLTTNDVPFTYINGPDANKADAILEQLNIKENK